MITLAYIPDETNIECCWEQKKTRKSIYSCTHHHIDGKWFNVKAIATATVRNSIFRRLLSDC